MKMSPLRGLWRCALDLHGLTPVPTIVSPRMRLFFGALRRRECEWCFFRGGVRGTEDSVVKVCSGSADALKSVPTSLTVNAVDWADWADAIYCAPTSWVGNSLGWAGEDSGSVDSVGCIGCAGWADALKSVPTSLPVNLLDWAAWVGGMSCSPTSLPVNSLGWVCVGKWVRVRIMLSPEVVRVMSPSSMSWLRASLTRQKSRSVASAR